jgi:type I restriction enzyme S subunit
MIVGHAINEVAAIFGPVPAHWTVDRLRDRLEPIVGGDWGEDPDASDDGTVVPVVRVADIRGLDVGTEGLTLRRVKETKLKGRLIGSRSLLIEKSGGGERTPVGRTVLGRAIAGDAICSNFMAKTDCGPTLYPEFVAYLLDAAYGAGINTAHIQQTTGIQNLRVTDYLNSKVGIPPIGEQVRIAEILDRSCNAISEAIAAKRQQLVALDGVKRDAIQIAVTQGLRKQPPLRATGNIWIDRVPEHWSVVSLKRIAEIQSGLTLGKDYDGPVVERPYLRVANVQDGHLDLTDVTNIEVPLAVARRVTLRPGDVLMTEGGDLDKLGRGTPWTGEIADCLHQNHIFAVRCFAHKLMPGYLAYLTASQYGRDYFEATGKKTTNLAATNSTKVGQFPIPLPPFEEQRDICEHLNKTLSHLKQVADCIQGQVDVLSAYRSSLIHEYVTGQRRVPAEAARKAVACG